MDAQVDFTTLWQRFSEPSAAREGAPCAIAKAFSEKLEEIIVLPLGDHPTRGQIAQAKYLLQEEWHAWRKTLPAAHPRRPRYRQGHVCVDEAYHTVFDRLQLLELTLRPPNIIVEYETLTTASSTPERPPSPPPVIIPATPFMGLADED